MDLFISTHIVYMVTQVTNQWPKGRVKGIVIQISGDMYFFMRHFVIAASMMKQENAVFCLIIIVLIFSIILNMKMYVVWALVSLLIFFLFLMTRFLLICKTLVFQRDFCIALVK